MRKKERKSTRKKRYKQDLQASPGSLMPRGALFKEKFDRKLSPSNNEDKLRSRLQITRTKRSYLYDKAFYVKEISSRNTQHENIIYMQAPFYIASNRLYQGSYFQFFSFFSKKLRSFDFHVNFL